MNTLLDTAGSLIYLVLSVVLLPLFLLVDGLILSVALYRNTRLYYIKLAKRFRKRSYAMPRLNIALKRGLVFILPNRH